MLHVQHALIYTSLTARINDRKLRKGSGTAKSENNDMIG